VEARWGRVQGVTEFCGLKHVKKTKFSYHFKISATELTNAETFTKIIKDEGIRGRCHSSGWVIRSVIHVMGYVERMDESRIKS
jgi:hypothetical protein